MCVYGVCIYVCVHVCVYPQRQEEGIRSLGARVTSVCELPDRKPGIQTSPIMIEQQVLLADEPSLQSFGLL